MMRTARWEELSEYEMMNVVGKLKQGLTAVG